jgi:hypothetical protein
MRSGAQSLGLISWEGVTFLHYRQLVDILLLLCKSMMMRSYTYRLARHDNGILMRLVCSYS